MLSKITQWWCILEKKKHKIVLLLISGKLCYLIDNFRLARQISDIWHPILLNNIQYTYFFLSMKGDFPQQGPRPTCDCISGPRLIPAVSWDYPTYIMRALPHVGLSISGRCAITPPWILGLWAILHRTRTTHALWT